MKKKKLFLLISLFSLIIITFILCIKLNIKADDDNLNYTDTYDNYNITRTYEDFYIASVNENFRSPSGCVLTLSTNEENLDIVKEEIQNHSYFSDKDKISMVSICVYRVINGSKMYSESTTDWNVNISDFTSFVSSKLPGLVLYEIEEKISDVDISAIIEIQLYTSISESEYSVNFNLVFDVEPYHVKKYENGDILKLNASYYCVDDENRININATIDENLFNDKYGFKTDGRSLHEWDDGLYYENYLVEYIDKKTNIILDTDDCYDMTPGIELESIPTEDLTIYAKLTFTQNGVEYTFYSNELTLTNPIKGLLIDGYNNRKSIGINNIHTLQLDIDLMDNDIDSVNLYLQLEDSDYEIVNRSYDKENPSAIIDGVETFEEFNDEIFKFDFNYNEVGTFKISGNLYYYSNFISYYGDIIFDITLTENEIEYTSLDKALTINTGNNIVCVAGGETIEIDASIANDILNDNEEARYEWISSRVNVIELDNNDSNKIIVSPVGGGVVTLTLNCYGKSFGSLSKQIVFNVIDDIYSISSLSVSDEFHYSNKPLNVKLNVDKYSNIVNFTPEWNVLDKDGNSIDYVINDDLSITLLSPASNDYTITSSYNGVVLDSITVEVRTINLNAFIQENIVWILLITLVFVGLVILLKVVLERKKSLVTKIEKTNKLFEDIDKDSDNVIKDLYKVRLSILSDIDYAKNLNMNALNEYEKTIRYLGKSLADIKEITKNKAKLSIEEYNELYDKLSHDLVKSLNVAREIEDAKEVAYKNSLMANENNIVKVEKDKKTKEQ